MSTLGNANVKNFLLYAPQAIGVEFLKSYQQKSAAIYPVTGSRQEVQQYREAGYECFLLSDDRSVCEWLEAKRPKTSIVFNEHIWETLAVINTLKTYSDSIIYVVNQDNSSYKASLCKTAGADYVIYTKLIDLDFLVDQKVTF